MSLLLSLSNKYETLFFIKSKAAEQRHRISSLVETIPEVFNIFLTCYQMVRDSLMDSRTNFSGSTSQRMIEIKITFGILFHANQMHRRKTYFKARRHASSMYITSLEIVCTVSVATTRSHPGGGPVITTRCH